MTDRDLYGKKLVLVNSNSYNVPSVDDKDDNKNNAAQMQAQPSSQPTGGGSNPMMPAMNMMRKSFKNNDVVDDDVGYSFSNRMLSCILALGDNLLIERDLMKFAYRESIIVRPHDASRTTSNVHAGLPLQHVVCRSLYKELVMCRLLQQQQFMQQMYSNPAYTSRIQMAQGIAPGLAPGIAPLSAGAPGVAQPPSAPSTQPDKPSEKKRETDNDVVDESIKKHENDEVKNREENDRSRKDRDRSHGRDHRHRSRDRDHSRERSRSHRDDRDHHRSSDRDRDRERDRRR